MNCARYISADPERSLSQQIEGFGGLWNGYDNCEGQRLGGINNENPVEVVDRFEGRPLLQWLKVTTFTVALMISAQSQPDRRTVPDRFLQIQKRSLSQQIEGFGGLWNGYDNCEGQRLGGINNEDPVEVVDRFERRPYDKPIRF
ncbi:20750_t:CDS:2 [Rhizophagus irregularis]|nr:20750_t:CDS:2 [Rhizophagus irregularis]